jgi:hypothetical protein
MMSAKTRMNGTNAASSHQDVETLYLKLLKRYYEEGDREKAKPLADEIEALLAASPVEAHSIRGEEIRSIIADLRGNLAAAIQSREAEIRKILELQTRTLNTPHWSFISQHYGFSDVSDRLDLLAILYDQSGELDRAIATLQESKDYCALHSIEFDAQDLLTELLQSRSAAATRAKRRLVKR